MVLTVGPGHTLREAAQRRCASGGVGAAVVVDPEAPGPGVITERDILRSVGAARIPTRSRRRPPDPDLTFAAPDWSLEHAAAAMVRGGFRHLVVVDGGELAGSSRCATSCAVDRRRRRLRRAAGVGS